MKILVFNAGSSTQKMRLYDIDGSLPERPLQPLWACDADWTRSKGSAKLLLSANGQQWERAIPAGERSAILAEMLRTLWSGETQVIKGPADIGVVGHRVVHGGPDYHASTLITPTVQAAIQRLGAFAPLHNPANLEGIETTRRVLGNVPQVAVFDTAFHRTLPMPVTVYPGPYEWFDQGIRRYGFHGISHQYCSRRDAEILGRELSSLRIINCHLGNGCSLAAIKGGQSIDTTMGFTPLEGLMMGSRSGSIDPSILLYLQRQQQTTVDQLDTLLNKESGLKGISGVSSDMRAVMQASKEGNERARLALEMFVYRLRFFIGAMLASLEGVDVLSFTGGIGENAPEVRAGACAAFRFLNLKIDADKNAGRPVDQDIATPDSAVRVLVVHTEEDWEIAKESWHVMQFQSPQGE
ncbi:MAG TPA: acetate kinase [Ktedonobacteraceae bacterium]|nr:acetate kinase [Ktedonobacteraceae bacterium]